VTFDHHRRDDDGTAVCDDALPELKVVRQMIHQGGEASNGFQILLSHGHGGTEGEVDRTQAPCLQDLGPEVRIDRDRLPAHRRGCRIGQEIKTIYQADRGIPQRIDHVGEKIRGHAHVGVADHHHFMAGVSLQLCERGHLGIGPEIFGTDHQFRVAAGMIRDQLAKQRAHRIIRRGHAEEKLDASRISQHEPALETVAGGGVGAILRLENGDRRGESGSADPRVQRESPADDPLPERNGEAEDGQAARQSNQRHGAFLSSGAALGKRQLRRVFRKASRVDPGF